MAYTVCIRTIVSKSKTVLGTKKPAFVPGFLAEPHDTIDGAVAQVSYLMNILEPKDNGSSSCKMDLFQSVREEFRGWAADTLPEDVHSCHKTVGVSICFDDAARAVKDGVPAVFIRDLGKDEAPRFEFFCPLDSATDHPTVQEMGYSAQVHDRHAALKNLAKKEKTPAPKLST